MKWGKIFFTIYLTGLLICFAIDIKAHPDWSINWSIYALAIAVLALSGFFVHFESKMHTAKETALLATLSALAALGRVPFAAIPNVQPTTFLVLLSGYVFGPGAGFAVGVLAALTSDFFLGLGPWTPWQMLAWGLAGWTAGFLRLFGDIPPTIKIRPHRGGVSPFRYPKTPPRLLLVVFSVLWGYFYGLIMNTWHWLTFIYPLTWQTFTATCAAAIWFDTFHAAGNGLFMWFMGRDLISTMDRFNQRLSVKFIDAEK